MRISSSRGRQLVIVALAIGGLMMSQAIPARAGLGGEAASVEFDAAALKGVMSQPPATQEQSAAYSTKSFVTSGGVMVREYSAPAGPVFGVAWQGRRPPDLRVLLGRYYPEYVAAAAARRGPVGLHHAVIAGPNSVVVLSGHTGHLIGRAYVPALAPSGVDPKAVVK